MSYFEVTLEGFTVNHETKDHIFQVDGKRDEVYIHSDIRLIDQNGNMLFRSEKRSTELGDANGFPHRIIAGSASNLGGLKTGDSFPYNPPWQRQGSLKSDHPPMLLWAGELTDQRAVMVTPTIWEWDGGTDLFNIWGQTIVDNGPAIAEAVMNIINATQGGSIPTKVIRSSLDLGLPALFKLLTDILGNAGDRPIGMNKKGDKAIFESKSLLLTDSIAEVATASDFGFGPGIVGIRYADYSDLEGDYMLYLKIAKTGNKFNFKDGSLWKEHSSAPVYVTYGGAKFWIPDPIWLQRYGGWNNVTVVSNGALSSVPAIPRDGTILREWSHAPVYVILNGQKCWIRDVFVLDRYTNNQRWSLVRVVPDGGLSSIPTGPDAV